MYERAFLAYGKRVMVGVLSRRRGIPFGDGRAAARTLRVMWFLREADCWMSSTDMLVIGAGRWQTISWTVADGLASGWIEKVGETRKQWRFRITDLGRDILEEADKYAAEEYQRSLAKVAEWKRKKAIQGKKKGEL